MIPTASMTLSVPSKPGTKPASSAPGVDVDLRQVVEEPEADDHQEAGDRELEAAVAALLQGEDRERDDRGDQAGRERRDAEEQVERDRRADELGEVGGDRDDLGLRPQAPGRGPREVRPAQLGQVAPRDDARPWPTGTGRASPSGSPRRSPTPAGSRTSRRRRCWSRSCPGRCRPRRPRTPARAAPAVPRTRPRARISPAARRPDRARRRRRSCGRVGHVTAHDGTQVLVA